MKNRLNKESHNGLKAMFGAAAAGATALLAYKFFVQPWHLHWGATAEEAEREMTGDKLIEFPDYSSTRAVTIDAKSAAIYPWIIQIGQGRGGVYSYDWIENLMGLNIHSVDEILEELQDLKEGDTIPLEPNGTGLEVKELKEGMLMLLTHPDGGWTWEFALYPLGENQTRVL